MRWLMRIIWRTEAATAIEYAIMMAMILLAVIGTVGTVGTQAANMWARIFNNLKSVVFGG